MTDEEYSKLMSGEAIFGDEFSAEEIEAWYADEERASYDIYDGVDTSQYNYLNWEYGFKHIAGTKVDRCLALGAADGGELLPISSLIDEFLIIEPEKRWWSDRLGQSKARYLSPNISGSIELEDESIDLVVAFGVLHHIPNVTFVISELSRVLKKTGHLLIREPVVAMGDWRYPRRGLTARERGIPRNLLAAAVENNSLKILAATDFDCPLSVRLSRLLGITHPYNNPGIVGLDRWLGRLLRWNSHYNPSNLLQKIAPSSCMIVARK